jgi:hypothetical protein
MHQFANPISFIEYGEAAVVISPDELVVKTAKLEATSDHLQRQINVLNWEKAGALIDRDDMLAKSENHPAVTTAPR